MVRWGDDLEDQRPGPLSELMSLDNFRSIGYDLGQSVRRLRAFFQARRA
jgi:hypothetical protein